MLTKIGDYLNEGFPKYPYWFFLKNASFIKQIIFTKNRNIEEYIQGAEVLRRKNDQNFFFISAKAVSN